MPKELDFENLRLCLDNYQTDFIYIRLKGSSRGYVKVNENLGNRTLDFKKNSSGLYLIVDSDEIFHFPLKDYHKGFSLAYERIKPPDKNGIKKIVMLSGGINPYDADYPEPKRSFLRHVFDDHLIEIFFQGRVDLKFHSWREKPFLKYWTIEKPRKIPEDILK